MNKKTLFLILLTVVVLPSMVYAQTLGSMAQSAMNAVIDAAGFIVVILWIITGILFLVAQGSPEKLKSARTALITSVAGTVVVIIANFATDFVGKIFGI